GQLRFDMIEMNLVQWLNHLVRQCEQDAIEGERRFDCSIIENLRDQWREYSCRIDVERMSQVFSNLVWNAVKYTTFDEGEIGLAVNVADHEVVIMVKDNGCGIAEDEIPYLFDRFYRVESDAIGEGAAMSGSG